MGFYLFTYYFFNNELSLWSTRATTFGDNSYGQPQWQPTTATTCDAQLFWLSPPVTTSYDQLCRSSLTTNLADYMLKYKFEIIFHSDLILIEIFWYIGI